MHSNITGSLPDPHALAAEFRAARPFRFFVVDDFFPVEFADALLAAFPPFERGNARDETGHLGGKSTIECIRELGEPYATLDDLVQSQPFLDWLASATGIPDLLYDPHYFGGGTHDNRNGQELDPHVDFNRHPVTGWHRRLNLIVYLNHDWHDTWGGSLELHSDPRREDDSVTLVTPLFNRCVVFETTEWSWHGFSKIALPEEKDGTTRRSIALYFYSRDRPTDELAPEHSTIYVDRPLPDRFHVGHTLTHEDVEELKVMLTRRDQHNQRLYGELIRRSEATQLQGSATLPGLFVDALVGLGRYAVSPRNPQRRPALKRSLQPFVTRLPPHLREPLRAAWRRWEAKAQPATALAPAPAASNAQERRLQSIDPRVDGNQTEVGKRLQVHPRHVVDLAQRLLPRHLLVNSARRIKRFVPPLLRARLRQWMRRSPTVAASSTVSSDYLARLQQERDRFAQEIDVNDLPPIAHYWSNTYLRPLLESFGFSNPDEFFACAIAQAPRSASTKHILSIGAGNCDTEVRVATLLAARGETDWRITCLDLVAEMLERGRTLASDAGLLSHFDFVSADFNSWQPQSRFDVVMANQCLHHVVELEALFSNIRRMLADSGRFVISDMIGRNGHQRWPEARKLIDGFWQELPKHYRFNRQLQRQEDRFKDWDCSIEGFEGIRSQDILALLCANFHFELFIPFGNLIDPFIDRGFGWNFNAEADWDRQFIDRVHAADVAAIASRAITPTHLMCVCTSQPPAQTRWVDSRDPASYIRDPAAIKTY